MHNICVYLSVCVRVCLCNVCTRVCTDSTVSYNKHTVHQSVQPRMYTRNTICEPKSVQAKKQEIAQINTDHAPINRSQVIPPPNKL